MSTAASRSPVEQGSTSRPMQPIVSSSPWIARFTRTHRALHWTNAVAFLALAASGLALHMGRLSQPINGTLGHLPHFFGQPVSIVGVHLILAIFYVAGPLLWLIAGNRRALLTDIRDIVHLDADDRAWLATGGGALGSSPAQGHTTVPPQGRFNAGQKINALATILAFAGFIITGLILTIWPPSAGEGHRGFLIAQALHVHALLALASVALVAGHIYLAALNPGTRASLQGMLNGRVSRSWARLHHAKWVDAVEEQERTARQTSSPR